MPQNATSPETISDFLAQKRIAIVGVSRDPKEFSASLFREFVKRGYDVIPVNPKATKVLGSPCFARVQDIHPRPDAALLMTVPEVTEIVVHDCKEAGIGRIWMYRAAGTGAVNPIAVEFCRQQDISVVAGECPFMFFPKNGFHGIHGFLRKITGQYPKHRQAA